MPEDTDGAVPTQGHVDISLNPIEHGGTTKVVLTVMVRTELAQTSTQAVIPPADVVGLADYIEALIEAQGWRPPKLHRV
ncbi:MAG: hypothetical protein ACYDC0_16740 [Acidimicrobiales bacterium]